jgi:DNA-directed RNA polymerase omega subunit
MEKGVVEKCLQKISDPFTLVVLASYRSQELASGVTPCVPTDGSKDALVALKEISSGDLNMASLEDRMITSLQKFAFLSEEGLLQNVPGERSKKTSEPADIHALFSASKTAPSLDTPTSILENTFSPSMSSDDLQEARDSQPSELSDESLTLLESDYGPNEDGSDDAEDDDSEPSSKGR